MRSFVHHLAFALTFILGGCESNPPAAPSPSSASSPPSVSASPSAKTATGKAAGKDVGPPPPDSGLAETASGFRYAEWVSAGADPTQPLALVVAIHGLGDDPKNFRGLFAGFERPARFILPRGLDAREGGGYSWFPLRARDPDVEALSAGIAKAADAIAAGVREVMTKRATKGDRVIVTGFSQGGMLSFTLATRHPDLFAAAFPVGGWLPPPLLPNTANATKQSYPRIEALHGVDDPALPIEPTRESVRALKALGLNVTLHEYPGVRHSIPPQMRHQLHQLLLHELTQPSQVQ